MELVTLQECLFYRSNIVKSGYVFLSMFHVWRWIVELVWFYWEETVTSISTCVSNGTHYITARCVHFTCCVVMDAQSCELILTAEVDMAGCAPTHFFWNNYCPPSSLSHALRRHGRFCANAVLWNKYCALSSLLFGIECSPNHGSERILGNNECHFCLKKLHKW